MTPTQVSICFLLPRAKCAEWRDGTLRATPGRKRSAQEDECQDTWALAGERSHLWAASFCLPLHVDGARFQGTAHGGRHSRVLHRGPPFISQKVN